MEVQNKMFEVVEKKEINDEERSIVAWGSRPVLDRDMEKIAADAKWELDNFKKNPVLCISHDYSKLPVGKVLWTKVTSEGLRFKAQFAKTPTGEELWTLYKDGIMNAFSIGFLPLKYTEPDMVKSGEPRRIYEHLELLEISCVSIPSCPAAIMEMYNDGKIKTKDFSDVLAKIKEESHGQIEAEEKAISENEEGTAASGDREEKEVVTKPETTENYHHIPVSEGHDGHKIRTIKVTDGIKALYCVECKEIKTYLFDVDKFTMEEARQWIQDHKKAVDTAMDIIDKDEEFDGLDLKLVDEYEEVDINIERGKENEKPCDQKSKEDEVEEETKTWVCPDCGQYHEDEKPCGQKPDDDDDEEEDGDKACGDKPKKPKKDVDDINVDAVNEDEVELETQSDERSIEVKLLDTMTELISVIKVSNESVVKSIEELTRKFDVTEQKPEENEPEEKEIDVEDIAIKAMCETLEKSGRTISSRNQQRIREAIETLSSLIEAEEKTEEVDIEVEQDSIDPEEAKSALQSIVKDFLSERPDVQTLIDERIKRAQGRMF